jgi:hypothetical protein
VLVGETTQVVCVVHLLVKVTRWVSTPSVPQEKPVVGVQAALVDGAVPVQKLFATTVPSVLTQVTAWDSWPEFLVPAQVPVRVWAVGPTPHVGVQEE